MSDTDTVSDDEDLFVFEYINRIKLLMLFDEIVGTSFKLSLKRLILMYLRAVFQHNLFQI